MNSKRRDGLYAAPRYPQTLKLCSQTQDSSLTGEDQKATARLSHRRAEGYDSAERGDLSLSLSGSAPMADNAVSEIELNSLRKADQILIETARSVYVFTIKDPKALSGNLIGGMLGNRLVDAYLLPAWVEVCGSRADQKSVKVGEKFTFIIEAAVGPKRLTTSTARALVHRKKSGAAHALNRRRRVTLEQVSD